MTYKYLHVTGTLVGGDSRTHTNNKVVTKIDLKDFDDDVTCMQGSIRNPSVSCVPHQIPNTHMAHM